MAQKRKKKTASKKRAATRKPGKRRASKTRKRRASKKRGSNSRLSLTTNAKTLVRAFPVAMKAAAKKHARALRLYGHTVTTWFVTSQKVGKALVRFTTNVNTGKTAISV
jgi:hypothetical protein